MKTINLSELANIDFLLKDVIMMEQCWHEGGEFNALRSPKKSQSFCYLNGCCIDYVFPDGTKLHAKEGDCVYIPKGARYKATVYNKTKLIGTKLLNFNLIFKAEEFNIWNKLCVVNHGGLELQKLFGNFITENNVSNWEQKACFYNVLGVLRKYALMERVTKSERYGVLAPAVKHLDECEKLNVSVKDLASMCYLSEGFFRKKFGECFGVSPKEYCLQRRINKAKELLSTGEFNVGEVSDMLDFSSPSYFCRIFKKKMGVPPQQFL